MRRSSDHLFLDVAISLVVVGALSFGTAYGLGLALDMLALFIFGYPAFNGVLNIAHGTAGFGDYFWIALLLAALGIAKAVAGGIFTRIIAKLRKHLPKETT